MIPRNEINCNVVASIFSFENDARAADSALLDASARHLAQCAECDARFDADLQLARALATVAPLAPKLTFQIPPPTARRAARARRPRALSVAACGLAASAIVTICLFIIPGAPPAASFTELTARTEVRTLRRRHDARASMIIYETRAAGRAYLSGESQR